MTIRLGRVKLGALVGASGLVLTAVMAGGTGAQAAGAQAAVAQAAVASPTVSHGVFTRTSSVQARAASPGSASVANPELPKEDVGGGPTLHAPNRPSPALAGPAATAAIAATAAPAPTAASASLVSSFDGINHFDSRTADGGNQFSLEPPDQGLCAGNGFVFESVNGAVRTFKTNGRPASGVVTLNQFYGYAPNINRTTGRFGPFPFDPSCIYDSATGRFFQLVNTLAADPATGNNPGPNELSLAVSQTSDPTGAWFVYQLPVQDDGTQGTPDHHCSGNPNGTGHGPCFGDYPHIGADANAIVLTTNEYSFFGPEFHGAQVYAVSKAALVAGKAAVTVIQFDTHGAGPKGEPGFTLAPAQSPDPSQFATGSNGTEYLLSSDAAAETGNTTEESNRLLVWALTNTAGVNRGHGIPALSETEVNVSPYFTPPHAVQQQGSAPLMDCLNDASHRTPLGRGCWRLLGLTQGPYLESLASLDSSDTRMLQVTYVNGELVGALDTALLIQGQSLAGIEAFVAKPSVHGSTVSVTLASQALYGAAGENLIYPAIGVTSSGKGVMAFTLVGQSKFPSAAYALFNLKSGFGDVTVAANGQGPADGFSDYFAYAIPGQNERPRWGDYGATSVVGGQVWIASEYIGQSCNLDQYMTNTTASPFGTCGNTRTALANWDTRISLIAP